jgi:dihydroorotase
MIIKNATVVDANKTLFDYDVEVKNGKFTKIAKEIKPKDSKVIDAKGLYLFPSMIDLNVEVYNRVLNYENLLRVAKNALKGGVGSVVLKSTCTPSVDSEVSVEFVNAKSKNLDLVNILASINSIDGENRLSNISTLTNKGAKAIYMNSDISGNNIRRVFEYSKMLDVAVFAFCNSQTISANGVMNDSELAFEMGLDGVKDISETSEVAKIREIARETKNSLLVHSISTNRSLKLLKKYKNIYSEVSIHHLLLDEKSCENFNTFAKIYPPLKSKRERERLQKALKDGYIDTLTSLHSAWSIKNKDVAFNDASFGIDSIKDYFSICYTHLKDLISLEEISKLTSFNPAKILKLNKGLIEAGYDADFILVNLNREFKSNNPLYQKLEAEVIENYIAGKAKIKGM